MNAPAPSRPAVRLAPGRDKSLRRRHPWVFAGAVAAAEEGLRPGDAVDVLSAAGERLGVGFWSPASQLRVRMLSFGANAPDPDDAWLRARIGAAWALRAGVWNRAERDAVRVVHGEADGLPGLVVDRYGPVLSVQLLSAGFDRRRTQVAAALLDLFPDCDAVWERSDAKAREREGLPPRDGLLALRPGVPEPDFSRVGVVLGGIRFEIDVAAGQKTGAYLDQISNRALVAAHAAGREVLDAFCCDGGFSLACLRAGATRATAVDSSAEALAAFRRNLALNGLAEAPVETLCADVFSQLRAFRDARRSFDLVVLDPPKFAATKAHVEKACRAYKDANLLAFKLLRPGGMLATFSCSGAIDPALFRTVVAEAALDAGREARIVEQYAQAPDHPVSLACPETFYLKGLLCAVP